MRTVRLKVAVEVPFAVSRVCEHLHSGTVADKLRHELNNNSIEAFPLRCEWYKDLMTLEDALGTPLDHGVINLHDPNTSALVIKKETIP